MRVIILRGKKLKIALTAGAVVLLGILYISFCPNQWLSAVSGQTRIVPIYEVATDAQEVGISFDASWGAEYTHLILDILDEYQVKATFFLVNIWLEDYPDIAKEIVDRGHEIGLHSTTHPYFTQLTDDEIIKELDDNYEQIALITGYMPCLFRPPYGDYNSRVVELVNSCGYTCIQWSVDSLDWMELTADEIIDRVMKDIHAGDIVLFHNNGLHTAEALPQILSQLSAQGLKAVNISALLLKDDYYIDVNGIQRQK